MLVMETDYPFLSILWTMVIFFAFIIWIWLLISVFADLFGRHDISGVSKTIWIIFVILVPYLGVFCYLITQGQSMAARRIASATAAQAQMEDHIKAVAGSGGSAASEIEKAKGMLDAGVITADEFEAIKKKALS